MKMYELLCVDIEEGVITLEIEAESLDEAIKSAFYSRPIEEVLEVGEQE